MVTILLCILRRACEPKDEFTFFAHLSYVAPSLCVIYLRFLCFSRWVVVLSFRLNTITSSKTRQMAIKQFSWWVVVLVILEVHQPNGSTMQTMSTIQIVEDVIYKSDSLCTIV